MKTLKQIYQALSAGKINQQQALQWIKASKQGVDVPFNTDANVDVNNKIKLLDKNKLQAGIMVADWYQLPIRFTQPVQSQTETTLTDNVEKVIVFCGYQTNDAHKTIVDSIAMQYQIHQISINGVSSFAQGDLGENDRLKNASVIGHTQSLVSDFTNFALDCLRWVQQLIAQKKTTKYHLQFLIAEPEASELNHSAIETQLFSAISGLLGTLQQENPDYICQVACVPEDLNETELLWVIAQNSANSERLLLQYRHVENDITCWTRQWQLLATNNQPEAQVKELPVFKQNGVYLITGGLGAIGLTLTQMILQQDRFSPQDQLSQQGQLSQQNKPVQIYLTGRSALTKTKQQTLATIDTTQSHIHYVQLDLTDANAVNELIQEITTQHQQLNGIFHCAGMTADNYILKKSIEEFSEVIQPKVAGTMNLDKATAQLSLDFFILFSSVAAIKGNLGQADYATANAFMDRFALYREKLVQQGLRQGKSLSINWPLWQNGGMQIDEQTQQLLQQNTGLHSLSREQALFLLKQAIAGEHCQVLTFYGQPNQIKQKLFNQFLPDVSSKSVKDKNKSDLEINNTAANARTALSAPALYSKIEIFLCEQLASLLKMNTDMVNPKAALEQYGVDSILAMNLTTQLEKTFGPLSKTLFFEYQSIAELAAYFNEHHEQKVRLLFAPAVSDTNDKPHEQLSSERAFTKTPTSGAQAPEHPSNIAPIQSTQQRTQSNRFTPTAANHHASTVRTYDTEQLLEAASKPSRIAIIGLSGRYPASKDVDAYWENLRGGVDCITEVPPSRWRFEDYYVPDRSLQGVHFSKWGGFIEGVDEFDPRFFNISPREAKVLDPQERLFLTHSWQALEDAGYSRSRLQDLSTGEGLGGQVGVYAGVMYGEYQ
ncbi:SDR family NAD(P)-dependent oxidoreductase, partial [Aliikangiella maris]